MKISGIYQILNNVTGKSYIGSSINIETRWRKHVSDLNCNIHQNRKLQNSWNKHGKGNFKFFIVELVPIYTNLLVREQYWIDKLGCVPNGYNLLPVAGSPFGYKHSEETKKKLSAAKLGKRNTPEHCANISASKMGNKYGLGRIISEEHKMIISQRMLGNKHCLGRVVSEKHKSILPKRMMGNKNGLGHHGGMFGKTHSIEARSKMSIAQETRRIRESKLTDEAARAILTYPKYYGYISALMKIHNVSRDIISAVLKRRTFKHITIDKELSCD